MNIRKWVKKGEERFVLNLFGVFFLLKHLYKVGPGSSYKRGEITPGFPSCRAIYRGSWLHL